MGYLYLLGNVLCVIAFSQTLRRGQRSGPQVLVVGATNYVVAALAGVAIAAWACGQAGIASFTPGAEVVGLAVFLGALYFTNLLVLLRCYEWAGVGVSVAVTTSGAVPTVLFSWLIWNEPMGPPRWVAVVLLPVALFLLRPRDPERRHLTLRGDLMLAATFLITAIINTSHKYAQLHTSSSESRNIYTAVLFCSAGVVSSLYVLSHRMKPDAPAIRTGAVLGLFNVAATLFSLAALTVMPAVVYFQSSTCLVIAGNALASRVMLKERLAPRQRVGIAAAIAVIILSNIDADKMARWLGS